MGFELLPCIFLILGRGFEDRKVIFGDVLRWLVVVNSEKSNNVRILGDWSRVNFDALKDLPDTRIVGVQQDSKSSVPFDPVSRGQ